MAEYINKAELVGNLDKFAPDIFTPKRKRLIVGTHAHQKKEVGRSEHRFNTI